MPETARPVEPEIDLGSFDPNELALIDRAATMLAAVLALSDAELNALFDAYLVARGQAVRDGRPRLVDYMERTGEFLLTEFTRRGIKYTPPTRKRPAKVRAALPVVKPADDDRER